MSRQPQAVLCHTNVRLFGEGSALIGSARLPCSRSFLALRFCYQCPIVHSTVLFKKSPALTVGGYLAEERHAEDFALWGRMLEQGQFIGLPERLVRLRVHGQSVSQQNLDAQKALARTIGVRHCAKFLQLDEPEAVRANSLLLTPARQRASMDWWWFLTRCAPRLRWQSAETAGWLLWQTLKNMIRC